MKKSLLFFLLTVGITTSIFSQDYYYYHNKRIPIQISKQKIYLSSSENVTNRKIEIDTNTCLIFNEHNLASSENFSSRNIRYERIIDFGSELSDQKYNENIKQTTNSQTIATPFVINNQKQLVASTIYFYVCLQNDDDVEILKEYALTNNVRIVAHDPFMPQWFTLALTHECPYKNAIQAANAFYESDLFKSAEPDWRAENLKLSSDPLFSAQWGLKNTGQSGGFNDIDINVESAWNYSKGNDIVVAVIDQGVQLNHPDLQNNIYAQSYDIETNSSPSMVYKSHGTHCAGIIGAIQDNNIGVSGVAPQCKIMSISVKLDTSTTTSKIATAINWAWMHGADILNNSYYFPQYSDYIDNAINNAITYGRNGAGCPVFFASGNDNNQMVDYPANLVTTIAVGAMSPCGERKNFYSCDGEYNWGSNFGSSLDIMAPGVAITTTDWHSGYETISGTSAACPHAAGVMALILSANPCLTAEEARAILCTSCDKLKICGLYQNNTYGKWYSEVGYGKINAHRAVMEALGFPSYSYYLTSSTGTMSSEYWWILAMPDQCSNIAVGQYKVKKYDDTKTLSFPYAETPIIYVSTNGYTAANPNNANVKCSISNLSHKSVTLKTSQYNVVSNISGQQIGSYLPAGNLWYETVIYDVPDTISQINYKTLYSSTYNRNAFQRIEATNFSTQGSSNVKLRAGEEIIIGNGCYFAPNSSGNFYACIEPFTDCAFTNTQTILDNDTEGPLDDLVEESLKTLETIYNDNSSQGILLYPNPVTGTLHIALLNPEETVKQVQIANLLGMVVLQQDNLQDGTINTSAWANGMYIAHICTAEGKIYHAKFVKK